MFVDVSLENKKRQRGGGRNYKFNSDDMLTFKISTKIC